MLRYFPKFYVILFLVLDSDNMRIADSKWPFIYDQGSTIWEEGIKKNSIVISSYNMLEHYVCSIRYTFIYYGKATH